ncbi:MAG: alcohol dehydrogenase catalytic domain-containing protein [Nitrospinota bacterium]
MRAMVLHEFSGRLREESLPDPEPDRGEAVIRVRACAVDQFDLTIRNGHVPGTKLPLILGHEVAGEVAAVGDGVGGLSVGERVASTLYVTCGRCRPCRIGAETVCENFLGYLGAQFDGGYAELMKVPAANLVRISDGISFEEGSVLANAIGTPYHGIVKRVGVRPGETVLITGAGGGVGLHAVQLARLAGGRVIGADISKGKLEAILKMGAERAVDPTKESLVEAVMDWTGGRGVDAAIELVGTATLSSTIESLAIRGRLAIIGSHTGRSFEADPLYLMRRELTIMGSRNCSKQDLREVVDLVEAGRVKPIFSEKFPLTEANSVLERMAKGQFVGRPVLIP